MNELSDALREQRTEQVIKLSSKRCSPARRHVSFSSKHLDRLEYLRQTTVSPDRAVVEIGSTAEIVAAPCSEF